MTAAVENMAYAGEVPWHGLGAQVSNDLTPEQMLKAAKLDWTVSKRPVFFEKTAKKAESQMVQVKDKFVLVRDSDQKILSMVGTHYKPVQNEEALDFFKKFTEAGQMNMETAGSLWGGRHIWSLARLNNDFVLGKEDEVRGFLLLSQPHIHGKSLIIQFTPIRVVCWNTLTYAIGSNLKGKAGAFRMPHSQEFNDAVKETAELALGLATEQMTEFKEASTLLSKKTAKEEQVEEFFCEILKYDPKKAKKKQDGESKEPRMLPMFRAALEHAPGAQMPTALGTWWGAVNAVTYVIDHETGRDREAALRSAWFSARANFKRRAMKSALDKAK